MSDAVRRPPRYASFPPGPQESLADIRAVRAGETRRVACYLRSQSGPYPRTFRRGVLEVGGHTATWKRAGAIRGSQLRFDAEVMSVLEIRQIGPRDQRLGEPRAHLFALVHCAAPAGSLDLAVPIADVPLIRW